LFFDLNNDLITVKPMKGTKERGKNTDEDKQFKNELKASTKDKLENKLIVDLMIDELKAISLPRSEEHTSELQSRFDLVCRLLLAVAPRHLPSFPTRRSSDLIIF